MQEQKLRQHAVQKQKRQRRRTAAALQEQKQYVFCISALRKSSFSRRVNSYSNYSSSHSVSTSVGDSESRPARDWEGTAVARELRVLYLQRRCQGPCRWRPWMPSARRKAQQTWMAMRSAQLFHRYPTHSILGGQHHVPLRRLRPSARPRAPFRRALGVESL